MKSLNILLERKISIILTKHMKDPFTWVFFFDIISQMKKKYFLVSILTMSSFLLPSCSNAYTGKIIFDLDGGVFLDEDFSTNFLVGEAGSPITQTIPIPYKEGYFFVGWREKKKDGSYRTINKRLSEDGNEYYYYPYGIDTFYAYFEPLVTIHFDLGEGKEKGKIIAPKYENENFSIDTLSGYASKTIASTDYLPSVDASEMHLNFEYWYSKYPFTISTDKNNIEHYSLDTTKSEGVYRFDKGTFQNNMEFLLEDITLYANYTQDPTITIHYNIDGMENYSFLAKDSVEDELINDMKEKFNIDYSISSENYYYPNDTKDYRFAGFYLDEKFTQVFFISSPIYTSSFDLYLKWNKKINLTLDYNGGKVDSKEKETISSYYSDDILGLDFYSSHIPSKDDGTFINYIDEESKIFDLRFDALPSNDLTLKATYQDYPILTLNYDYPSNYTGEKLDAIKYQIAPFKSITDVLKEFKDALNEEKFIGKYFYTLSTDNKKITYQSDEMLDVDLTLYLQVDYVATLNIITYTNESGNYLIDEEISPISVSFKEGQNLTSQDIPSLEDEIIIDDNHYLYDELYIDSSLNQTVTFPLYKESNHNEIPILTLYRKMTKGIKLTFIYEGETDEIGSLYVIPGSDISKYVDEINALVGNYESLSIDDKTITSLLPFKDSTIVVKGHH